MIDEPAKMTDSTCRHVVVTLIGDTFMCDACSEMDMQVTVSSQELGEFFRMVREIVQTLDKGGMVDTARGVREQAKRLVVQRQFAWRD